MEYNQHQKKLGMFFHYRSQKLFFPFISIHSPNTLHRMEILQERSNEIHIVAENIRISEQLLEPKKIHIIKHIETFLFEFCDDLPNAFWENNRNEVSLPFVKGHHIIPHRSKAIAMSTQEIKNYREEIAKMS